MLNSLSRVHSAFPRWAEGAACAPVAASMLAREGQTVLTEANCAKRPAEGESFLCKPGLSQEPHRALLWIEVCGPGNLTMRNANSTKKDWSK